MCTSKATVTLHKRCRMAFIDITTVIFQLVQVNFLCFQPALHGSCISAGQCSRVDFPDSVTAGMERCALLEHPLQRTETLNVSELEREVKVRTRCLHLPT